MLEEERELLLCWGIIQSGKCVEGCVNAAGRCLRFVNIDGNRNIET